jgi:divalent metal cation (Fe/Co/Zn/Cd) transporter
MDTSKADSMLQRGLRLEYATLGWNVVGTVVVVTAAIAAHSVALAGFGLDSLIEIVASLVVVWELKGINRGGERRALRLIGGAFVALAIYVLLQAGYVLIRGNHPHHSPLGIAWLAATVAVMLALAWGKGRTGRALGNPVLITESRVTVIDAYLAAAVLIGLALNSAFGWWWADPLASLVIVYYGFREGLAAFSHAGSA